MGPYQSPGGQQQHTQPTTFVDSAGRLTFGTPPPRMPPQQYTSVGLTGGGMLYQQQQPSIPTSTSNSYPSAQMPYPASQPSYSAAPLQQQVSQHSFRQNSNFDPNYGNAPSFARPPAY